MQFSKLAEITNGQLIGQRSETSISKFTIDSRKCLGLSDEVFIAISGEQNNGHDFISEAHHKGVRQFIVEKSNAVPADSSGLLVSSSLAALQSIARYHREKFDYPIVGITGSNGKTTVKEWLYQFLITEKSVIKSPKSYNSQVGVPLSLIEMGNHDIGLFEAGISKVGEMTHLQNMISPTLGVFTNIGEAHSAGFTSIEQKIEQKAILFQDAKTVICCTDHKMLSSKLETILPGKLIRWSLNGNADYNYLIEENWCELKQSNVRFKLPFSNKQQVENLLHAITAAKVLGITDESINAAAERIKSIPMRLELKKAINGCHIVDDSYNFDLQGLEVAMDFAKDQNPNQTKTLIVSDIFQSTHSQKELSQRIHELATNKGFDRIIHIGAQLTIGAESFESTEGFLSNLPQFKNETILVKGARKFGFEKIVERLSDRKHGTLLEVNFEALRRNLNKYRSRLSSDCKLMVMVKANAYGCGLVEVAGLLEQERVDYLGVAYVDEAIVLRRRGISTPIMIMNPGEVDFSLFEEHQLEPEIFSLRVLNEYLESGSKAPVHLKLETGMNRLGFDEPSLEDLISIIRDNKVKVASIFTHFSSSDDSNEDSFTHSQAEKFKRLYEKLMQSLPNKPLIHAVNSAGLVHFPKYHFDMVRLGIGLYGFDPTGQLSLESPARLKTHISQIREVESDESIGYSRKGKSAKSTRIATIPIGYADGFLRIFGNGNASVHIHNRACPTIGNICMDMTMIDLGDLDASEGDEVVIFGKDQSLEKLAESADTIPYEILTNVSDRVKRVYVSD